MPRALDHVGPASRPRRAAEARRSLEDAMGRVGKGGAAVDAKKRDYEQRTRLVHLVEKLAGVGEDGSGSLEKEEVVRALLKTLRVTRVSLGVR